MNNDNQSINELTDKVFYILSKFKNSYKNDSDILLENYIVFELGCYIMFSIDLWHHLNNKQQYRRIVVNSIINNFLSLFQETLETNQANLILGNRLTLYSSTTKTESWIEKSTDMLINFIALTEKHRQILLFDTGTPIPIALGELAKWQIAISVQEYLIAFLPLLNDTLKEFYISYEN